MHIAAAFKRPVISLWGNTVPEFGMYPYYGENFLRASAKPGPDVHSAFDILEVKNLSCRPCSKMDTKKCPKGHFKCMEMISSSEIIERTERRIR
jgi:ADP-heptose:LPS heptosyltransferase